MTKEKIFEKFLNHVDNRGLFISSSPDEYGYCYITDGNVMFFLLQKSFDDIMSMINEKHIYYSESSFVRQFGNDQILKFNTDQPCVIYAGTSNKKKLKLAETKDGKFTIFAKKYEYCINSDKVYFTPYVVDKVIYNALYSVFDDFCTFILPCKAINEEQTIQDIKANTEKYLAEKAEKARKRKNQTA